MWEKRLDSYLGSVYFTFKYNVRIRELRFIFNICVDSVYESIEEYKLNRESSKKIHKLNKDFSEYISLSNEFDKSKKLEYLLSEARFSFNIPDEFKEK